MAKKVNEVVSILKEAIAKIEDENRQRDVEEQQQTPSASSLSFSEAVAKDLKRAFPSLSGGGKRPCPVASKKGKKSVSYVIQPKETWTHDFCLLASPDQDISPSFDDLGELREAGLGRRKIVFPSKTGKFEHLRQTLEKEFEKLKTQDGAFELLRAETGGISRPLKLLSMPSDGYSIPYLKNLVGSSTVIYIRPMKSCISKEKLPQVITSSSPFTECPSCENLIPIFSLRQHVSLCQATKIDDDTDKELELSVFCTRSTSNAGKSNQLKDNKGTDNLDVTEECEASTSKGTSFIDDGVVALLKIFPDHDVDTVREALIQHESVELAADALSSNDDDKTGGKTKEAEMSIHDVLKKLKRKMKSSACAERLKVDDEEDIAIDFLQYYKSKHFDPTIPITVRYKGQPGVDSGGLMRQAFTTVFKMLANNEVPGIRLFTGPPNRVTPIYSSENLLTNIFETIGKMVSHSLILGGPGFPYLAPAVFWYVATGDLNEGISRAAPVDVVDAELCSFLEKVKAEPECIHEISKDPSFISLLQECGETRKITEGNKLEVIQALILHATVLKHKAALDHFRKGLSTLGLLSEIEKNATKFEKFFVHSEEEITAAFVTSLLKQPQISTPDSDKAVEMLYTFINKADHQDLSAFLSFTTGSRLNTGALKPNCISVSVENDQGFFSSTCSLELKLPVVPTYSEFEILLRSVMTGKKFTTV